jgi:hypothetical protein
MNIAMTRKFDVISHQFDASQNLYWSDNLFIEISLNNIENSNKPLRL